MNWPLMVENITHADKTALMVYLASERLPRLTNGPEVAAFEREFSDWLGVKYSVMVNSGSSANLITLAALRLEYPQGGEVIVPAVTWVSDIAAVLHAGFTPVFVDIRSDTLGMNWYQVFERITDKTRAVFVTHCLGFNAFSQGIGLKLKAQGVHLIEDCCESLGATMNGHRLGSHCWASNFSFYYAHHMSTIEGGMVCTNDERIYQTLRQFRSHGLLRERTDKDEFSNMHPDLDPQFVFSFPAYNVRSTELNAVIGRSQLKRLDASNQARSRNLECWLSDLDSSKYVTDYVVAGSCNYALPLVLIEPNVELMNEVTTLLTALHVEYRRGTAGGGNQLRQPYARERFGAREYEKYPQADHVHFYGLYVGNFPSLDPKNIAELCRELNDLQA